MKSKKYWIKRAAQKRKLVDATIEETVRKAKRAYSAAFTTINKEVQYWLYRFADEEGISYAQAKEMLSSGEMNEYRMTLEEYIEHGERLDIDPSWESAMIKASAVHHVDRLTAVNNIIRAEIEQVKARVSNPAFISKIATTSFAYSMFSLDTAIGFHIGFREPDIRRAIQTAREPWTPDGMDFVKREGINNDKVAQDVEKMLTRACVTGEPYDDLARELSERSGLAQYDAERIIRTEATNAATEGERASYETSDIDQYEVIETLDMKTCDICGEMDGFIGDVKDMEPGVNAPPFHPNCRGDTVPHFADDWDDDSRIARDEDGAPIHVDGDMTYDEWSKEYGNGQVGGNEPDVAPEEPKKPDEPEADQEQQEHAREVNNALEYYVSGEGMYVNQWLRDPSSIPYWAEDDQRLVNLMDEGTKEPIREKKLFRSVDASAVFGNMSQIDYDNIHDYIVYGPGEVPKSELQRVRQLLDIEGKELKEKGFMSTTKDEDIALEWGGYTGSEKPIVLEFDVPKGITGADLSRFDIEDDPQKEVLLARGQRYVIEGITKKQGQIIVKAALKPRQ